MLRNQNRYETFIRLEYLYRGFLEAFEEEIGDINIDKILSTIHYRYNFHDKESCVRVSRIPNKKSPHINDIRLIFKVDFNIKGTRRIRRCTEIRSRFGKGFDTSSYLDENPPEIIDKFKWIQEHNKPEYKKKLANGIKKISAFSSIKISISGGESYLSYKDRNWTVNLLSHSMKIDLDNPNVGRDVYQFFKRILLSISLIS
ncbi:MAG: hypothetical protein KH016_03660 [Haemophilus parainfluenzae]|jgi:hypothetical protein|nr:hypothetical protein [Haemophilus parainfluenzae]